VRYTARATGRRGFTQKTAAILPTLLGKAVYLTGSHTWANIVDHGETDLPPAFDFGVYPTTGPLRPQLHAALTWN
jgi:hypothetical protein